MSKDLSTKEQKDTVHPEKISLNQLQSVIASLRELLIERDLHTPSYEWLCGVRDGINLFADQIPGEPGDTVSVDELIELFDRLQARVEDQIMELYTKIRLLYTE